jgi:hypothetical protein
MDDGHACDADDVRNGEDDDAVAVDDVDVSY